MMDELLQVGVKLFETAPGPAALIAVAFLYFRGNGKQEKFVKKEDCHSHIDGLKESLKSSFSSIHDDIREIRSLLISHIDSGRIK